METLLKQFGGFIKRSMLPASVLLLFLSFFAYRDEKLISNFDKLHSLSENNIYLEGFIIFTLLISLSFFMAILTQLLFDNLMKEDFNPLLPIYKHESHLLNQLREKTIKQLQEENPEFQDLKHTDFLLYQVIGRKLQFYSYKTDTRRYIDEIKSGGSIFIAILIAFLIELTTLESWIYIMLGIFLILIIFTIALEYILSKYRSRNIRMYINYIIGDK